jgi:CheY-like chemotaxis protein
MSPPPTTRRFKTGFVPASAGDVLVVEDDPQVRETAVEILALGGLLAAGVANGAEALRCLEHELPRLILLDLRMPVMDGWSFLRRRVASERLWAIPVIVLSGEPTDRILRSSVDGWIAKPFSEEELLGKVTEVLRRIDERRAVQAATPRRQTRRR